MSGPRITPDWLRPLTAAAFLGLYAGLLFGSPWPRQKQPAVAAPIAVEVVPMSKIVAAADAPQQAQTAAVTAVASAPSEAQVASKPASQTAEVSADVPTEIPAAFLSAPAIQAQTLTPDASVQVTHEPPPSHPRSTPKAEHERPHRRPARTSAASSRATAIAHNSHAEMVTGSLATANYRAIVAAELNRRKFYPASARSAGIEGVVVVSFTVGDAGKVITKTIVRSSGQPTLDEAARDMMAALSLPAPPGGRFRATVPIQFDMRN